MDAQRLEIGLGACDQRLYIHVAGSATHMTCPTADRLVADYLASHPENPAVVLDLDGCVWVDSTFTGWLVALRRRLAAAHGKVILSRCSEPCEASLARMSLADWFPREEVPRPAHIRPVPCATDQEPGAHTLEFMLAAHEELARTNPMNEAVFTPIANVLRRELRQQPRS